MKITVGDIVIEDIHNGDSAAALELIRELRGDATAVRQKKTRSESMLLAAQKVDTGTGTLNQIQYRTWQYLADNDCAGGIHVSQVAHAFGVPNTTANSRLLTLQTLGYAERIAKGYYKALTPENG